MSSEHNNPNKDGITMSNPFDDFNSTAAPSTQAAASRPAPVQVPSITIDGLRLQQVFNAASDFGKDQRSGYLAAYNGETLAWLLEVYTVGYSENPYLETDVQEVYFTSLQASLDNPQEVLIENEHGQRFAVNIADQSIKTLEPNKNRRTTPQQNATGLQNPFADLENNSFEAGSDGFFDDFPQDDSTVPQEPGRVAGPTFDSVTLQNIRYQQVMDATQHGEEQRTGFIAAYDGDTLAWMVKVYPVDMNDPFQSDVYITAISIAEDGKQLVIDNQRGEKWLVNPETKTSKQLK